jgi:hypothetical protein
VKKIAQNVAQPIFGKNYCITSTLGKRSPILVTLVKFKKALQSKQSPQRGETAPNLVTLFLKPI